MSPLITRYTAFSFPGMREDANTTVSPGPTETLWSRLAIRLSTAIGSPCEPVHMSTTSSGGMSPIRLASMRTPGGTVR